MNKSVVWVSTFASVAWLAGCAVPAPAPAPPVAVVPPPVVALPPPAQCSADAAKFAIGQELSPQLEAAARVRSGADASRVLKPGQAVTMDFNGGRVNLEVDARNRVKVVRCG